MFLPPTSCTLSNAGHGGLSGRLAAASRHRQPHQMSRICGRPLAHRRLLPFGRAPPPLGSGPDVSLLPPAAPSSACRLLGGKRRHASPLCARAPRTELGVRLPAHQPLRARFGASRPERSAGTGKQPRQLPQHAGARPDPYGDRHRPLGRWRIDAASRRHAGPHHHRQRPDADAKSGAKRRIFSKRDDA